MIGKFFEGRAAQARWIVVASFWKRGDSINGRVQFSPKSIHEVDRDLRIFRGDFAGIPCCSRVNDESNPLPRLSSTSLLEFLQAQPLHKPGVQLLPPADDLLVVHPIMGFVESAQKEGRQFGAVWRGEVANGFAEFGNLGHAGGYRLNPARAISRFSIL